MTDKKNTYLVDRKIMSSGSFAIYEKLQDDFLRKLQEFLIEGLKRKGFELEFHELEKFIKEHVTVTDDVEHKQRIYSVDAEPFLLHNYESSIDNSKLDTLVDYTITASLGSCVYL